jgi:hypothetical protein
MLDRDFPKIQAIKEVRAITDAGLKEAKEAVEAVMSWCTTYAQVVREACHVADPSRFKRGSLIEEPELDYKRMFEAVQDRLGSHADYFVRDTIDEIHTKERDRVLADSVPYQVKKAFDDSVRLFLSEYDDLIDKLDNTNFLEDILTDCIRNHVKALR